MDKPAYKLTVKLEGYRPEAVHAALNRLEELCREYDHAATLKASAAIESTDEDQLLAIRNALEAYLRANRTLVDGTVRLDAPLVRPRPTMVLMFADEERA